MSSWVGAWLQGRNDGDEEMKGDDASSTTDTAPTVMPSADEIRRKRLERLQKMQEQQQAAAAASSMTDAPAQAAASTATAAATAPATTSAIDPTTNTPLSIASTRPTPAAAPRTSATAALKPRPIAKKRSASSLQSFTNDMIQRILQLTLSPSVAAIDRTLFFLTEFAAESATSELTAANVSEVLYARIVVDPVVLSASPQQPLAAVAYLEQCYYRCRDERQKLQSPYVRLSDSDKRDADQVVASIEEMCVNYSATALTEPEFFPFEAGSINADAFETLVRTQSNALTPAFVDAVALALDASDDASVTRVFAPLFQKLVSELFLIQPPSLFADFYRNIYLLTVLSRTKALAAVLTALDGFLLTPPCTGRRLQDATALGLILRFCCGTDPQVAQMFTNITKRTKIDVDHSVATLQTKLTSLQNAATELLKVLLKAGGTTRERVLLWLEQAVAVNAERAKENPDMNITSTDGMMLNLTVVLLRLCGPFLPPAASMATNAGASAKKKTHLIDTAFLEVQSTVFPFDATKLLGHTNETDERRTGVDIANAFNFITRCYFVTARAVHLGPVSAMGHYMRILRQLSYFQSRLNDPVAGADPRLRAHFDTLATSKMVLDAELLHPDLLHDVVRFALLSAEVVTLICAAPSATADVALSSALTLPLPPPTDNATLAHVPEHVVDDICTVLIFVARLQPKTLQPVALDSVLQLIVVVLASPTYVRSPHLRAKMSDVLFRLFLPTDASDERETAGTPSGLALLTTNALAQQHLAPCLLRLYGDVEHTGFYDKLEHRYNIACLLKFLWRLPAHKQAFVRIAHDANAFVKFAHGLMNHINGLVTDALISLPEIKVLQDEMQNVPQWLALDESVREQKQSLLAEKERTVTSSLQLANETIHMMAYLTSEIQAPFVDMPELEDRLVSMLTSVLVKLAGPRGLELKVTNPEQYKFRPKQMLTEIVETLLHFAHYPSFHHAVATNGYYDAAVFAKSATIVERLKLVPENQITQFQTFVAQVAVVAQQATNLEETLGEIPDAFLDPLMCTLMKDPVVLPTSGYSMDRATITQHLLNDQTDPFTRAPLTIEQLTPNTELKATIEQWIQEQQMKQMEGQIHE